MFLYVCKQTFRKLFGYITREFLGLRVQNFQGIIFIWTRAYKEIFKSAISVPLKYFTSFKVAFRIQIRKKILRFKNLSRKTEKKWWFYFYSFQWGHFHMNTRVKIKRRFHFHVATHMMCRWNFISLTLLYLLFFLSQLGYLLSILIGILI